MMRPDDLRTFLHLLAQADQLARITVPVDPCLELAAIVNRTVKGAGGGKALLFEQVTGARMAVASNLLGTPQRVAWALGTTDLDGVARKLSEDLMATGATSPETALAAICAASAWLPVTVSRPAWAAIDYGSVGLDQLPAITAWPGDGGAFLTMAQVFTRDPETGSGNCGMYRLQIHDQATATIRCRQNSGMAGHLTAWHARGEALPVAVALGGPPALTWAAAVSLPPAVEETAFCGYLSGRPLQMSACRYSDLQVPASAEVVIEGFVDPGMTRPEGPFGNHTGAYDVEPAAPMLRVTAVHAREEAICPWTLVGPPPMENIQLARVAAQLLLPLVRMTVPAVRALHLPAAGIFHRAALVSVDRAEERPANVVAQQLRSTLLLRGARVLVLCADDHPLHDAEAVLWRVLNRVDWERDLLIENGMLTIDARRLPAGEPVRCRPDVLARVLARWEDYRIG